MRKHVEPRQPDRTAGRVDRADGDADNAHPRQRPLVDQDGGGDAERDHIGQRVELDAEVALRPRQPRHPAVEGVEEAAEEDGHRRAVEVVAGGFAGRERDRVNAAKDAADGEEVRQNEHQLAQVGPRLSRPPALRGRIWRHAHRVADASTARRGRPCTDQ